MGSLSQERIFISDSEQHESLHFESGGGGVTGDAKPWTLAQVAAGEPVKNALAEGRLHNIGVITNAAEAGVTHVGAVPLSYHVPTAHVGPHVYYGKREAEAEPYTLA